MSKKVIDIEIVKGVFVKDNIIFKEIFPSIFLFKFSNQYHITSTFIRLQEFYESSDQIIKDNYFTLEDIIDRYSDKKGNFTYFSDWSGFNVSRNTVKRFYEIFFIEHGDFTKKERILFDIIINNISFRKDVKDFYIIGIYTYRDINHELSHAFYNLDSDYEKEMKSLIRKYQYKKEVRQWLYKIKYSKEQLDDEMQAYLSTSNRNSLTNLEFSNKWEIPEEFNQCYKKYKKIWKNKKL